MTTGQYPGLPLSSCYEVHYCGFRTRIEQKPGESLESCKARLLKWVERIAESVCRQRLINPDKMPEIYLDALDALSPDYLDKKFAGHMQRHILASLWREAATTSQANANARASALAILSKHYGLPQQPSIPGLTPL